MYFDTAGNIFGSILSISLLILCIATPYFIFMFTLINRKSLGLKDFDMKYNSVYTELKADTQWELMY